MPTGLGAAVAMCPQRESEPHRDQSAAQHGEQPRRLKLPVAVNALVHQDIEAHRADEPPPQHKEKLPVKRRRVGPDLILAAVGSSAGYRLRAGRARRPDSHARRCGYTGCRAMGRCGAAAMKRRL
jgi:hypothetical protein